MARIRSAEEVAAATAGNQRAGGLKTERTRAEQKRREEKRKRDEVRMGNSGETRNNSRNAYARDQTSKLHEGEGKEGSREGRMG
jgi:hypothetical protein